MVRVRTLVTVVLLLAASGLAAARGAAADLAECALDLVHDDVVVVGYHKKFGIE
jgi:hypothetical protein